MIVCLSKISTPQWNEDRDTQIFGLVRGSLEQSAFQIQTGLFVFWLVQISFAQAL